MTDPRIFHWSTSRHKAIPITEMDEYHIVNSILRQYEEWIQAVRDSGTQDELIELLLFPPSSDIRVQSLTYEIVRREQDGERDNN